jgi:AmiR/NasT family two-component response regulator
MHNEIIDMRVRSTDGSTADAEDAIERRDVIGQAKGLIMAESRVTADEAFAMLVTASQRENRKLYQIAQDLVDRHNTRCAERPEAPPAARR